jgi:hypothetical protein
VNIYGLQGNWEARVLCPALPSVIPSWVHLRVNGRPFKCWVTAYSNSEEVPALVCQCLSPYIKLLSAPSLLRCFFLVNVNKHCVINCTVFSPFTCLCDECSDYFFYSWVMFFIGMRPIWSYACFKYTCRVSKLIFRILHVQIRHFYFPVLSF